MQIRAFVRRPFAARLTAAAAAGLLSSCGDGPGRPQPTGDTDRGRALMAQYQCGRCHEIPGVAGAQGRLAASLEHVASRSYIAGRLPNEPATLVAWIVDPAKLVPGTTMPAVGATEAEARDMAAYLGTLK